MPAAQEAVLRGLARGVVAVVLVGWVAAHGSSRVHAQSSGDPAPSAAPAQDAVEPAVAEMVVTGQRASKAQQLQQSAEAVSVVELSKAKEQSADLGEVLARTQGVAVRREGGLGSSMQFSLNGLTDDQVRFFLDGVPLEQAGYPNGIGSLPVNLVDRIEIYRGVVPVRFGADALGGAVNVVTPEMRRSYLSGSYQVGSFGTHRITVDGRYLDKEAGFVLGHTAFLDLARNDYDVSVKLGDDRGKTRVVSVPRFHDGYRAFGATLEVGVIDKPWAKRLTLTGFAASTDKQLQHNRFMQGSPYGEPTYGDTQYGATARYSVAFTRDLGLEVVANLCHRLIEFRDVGQWTYNWLGERTSELAVPGETGNSSDARTWQNAGLARVLLTWEPAADQTVRLSLSPTYTARFGRDVAKTGVDRASPLSSLFTLVSGLEYELNLWDELLSNELFVKDYVYHASLEASTADLGSSQHRMGAGDALRVRIAPWFFAKASYEYATRLPRPDEVLGNGALTLANPSLVPEVSHNANLGARLEWKRTSWGSLSIDGNAFLRDSDRLIYLGGGAQTAKFENVYSARSLGVEAAASWTAPHRLASLDGSFTWLDQRNTSSAGQFAASRGDRLVNRPYLFGSWAARLHFDGVGSDDDALELFYYGRYVHSFYVGWESAGLDKQRVLAQLAHDVGVTWLVDRDFAALRLTVEVQNLLDAKLFDNFGVQRPGRGLYAKLTATLP